MPTKPPPSDSDFPTHSFPTAQDLESFLEREHTTLPGFYLKLAKKSSGIASVSAAEAVEVALCFGWIDGRANTIDQDWWQVRYTPRRAKSLWSQKNVGTIERLVKDGRIRPAGLAAVEAAKKDGRWDRAYDGPASITVPGDLEAALKGDSNARAFFEGLSKSDRWQVLHRLQTIGPAKRAERIEALVEGLAKGKISGVSGKVNGKATGKATGKAVTVQKKSEGKNAPSKKRKIEKDTVVKVYKCVESEASFSSSTRQLRSRKPASSIP